MGKTHRVVLYIYILYIYIYIYIDIVFIYGKTLVAGGFFAASMHRQTKHLREKVDKITNTQKRNIFSFLNYRIVTIVFTQKPKSNKLCDVKVVTKDKTNILLSIKFDIRRAY